MWSVRLVHSDLSIFGSDIVGRNLDLEETKKIVQDWFFVTKKKKYNSVELPHTNIPKRIIRILLMAGMGYILIVNMSFLMIKKAAR
jgi:hypothetical protein